jgi:hypothetical protein
MSKKKKSKNNCRKNNVEKQMSIEKNRRKKCRTNGKRCLMQKISNLLYIIKKKVTKGQRARDGEGEVESKGR